MTTTLSDSSPSILRSSQRRAAKAAAAALGVAVLVFLCVAPTLTWVQFTGGNENIVVQTALEMRHGGPKLVPQMMGEPRVKKPPLVAWITALTMRQETVDRLEDPLQREKAYVDLAWQVRWTGLLAGCVTIFAAFGLGLALFDARIGLFASVVAGSTLLFQQYMRQSTSDVHLAMWVVIANAFFAMAIVRGRIWSGLLLGAVATGMAFLCKGPVALLETVLPALVMTFLPLGKNRDANEPASASAPTSTRSQITGGRIWAVVVAVLLFLLIALPWFLYVRLTVPAVMTTWFTEVSRHGATDLEPGNPAMYLQVLPLSWPWIVMLVAGLVAAWRLRTRADAYTVALLVLPLLIMVWFPDRKPRYLLPMIGPIAVLCARAIAALLDAPRADRGGRGLLIGHYVALGLVCIGFPLAGALHPALKTVNGQPWYPLPLAIWIGIGFLALMGLGLVINRYWRSGFIAITFVCLMGMQTLFMYAYRHTNSGLSEMKPLADAIREIAPSAAIYDWNSNGRRADEELAIYLNRTILRADPATLTPSDRPLVYITRQGKNDQDKGIEPTPPAGWRFLAKAKERKNYWWAFIRTP